VKFQPDRIEGVNVITSHAPGVVGVNAQPWRNEGLLVPWQGEVCPWVDAHRGALQAQHFEALVPYRPELVIFGSGPSLQFPAPALLRALIEARIGLETMDTAAACRTYNILAAEGRRVLAALLIG
jgi:uncharacterized protein